ncbi:RES domain-containing protein [uncultured Gilvimarinus sp.]|uniref:RES domain-containing protein n=1 Tax=uncultured Gilvimarinus sp. TaxID=1689143 RepID=UPI0030DAE9E3
MNKVKLEDFWHFLESTSSSERHFLSERNLKFLDALYESSKSRVKIIPKGSVYYRARVNPAGVNTPYDKAEMKPIPNLQAEGRVNPFNLNVLYLANRPEVCVAESRPADDESVTVATFEILADLRLVNLLQDRPDGYWWCNQYSPDTDEDDESFAWTELNGCFSKPVTSQDSRLNYIPTQIVSEYFKMQAYDGVVYQSQFDIKGVEQTVENGLHENIAIFDLNVADAKSAQTYIAKRREVDVSSLPGTDVDYAAPPLK